jgi:hypothetical protein
LRQVYSLFQSGFRECDLVLSLFKFHYSPLSRSSSNYVLLLPRLHVPSTFPSITCFRRQFLRKMWPMHVAFLCFIVCRMSLLDPM